MYLFDEWGKGTQKNKISLPELSGKTHHTRVAQQKQSAAVDDIL
ncbi:hypothetical protein [Xenorhabdus bovienii]|nr:hypothetical protein [Xenorhabdus bovienii]